MPLRSLTPAEAAADLGGFDAILDARSPAEFAEDHLPGAVNWPVLDDEQRRIVGTLYVQTSALEARKLGATMVARNIADHLDRWIADKPRDWQPLVYCWRGGQRSGSLAWFLDQIGFRTAKLAGGYKGFRAVVRQDLEAWPARFQFRVLAGRTGSGKTRLLQALAAAGAQVLDLEGLAAHRGSILGGLPGQPQPTQKAFDNRLWQALRALDPARPVYVESESKKIGRLQVPEALIGQMHAQGEVLRVQMPDDARVQLLLEDYGFFAQDVERFCQLLDGLVALRGKETVARWQAQARAGDWAAVFSDMMLQHYDPLYNRSMDRHYASYAQARPVQLADGSAPALDTAARALLTQRP
ncbi:tRNA 2-selenouridine(34) synthase MnmH [Pseudaquabacterium pictum]|uniref:tRNA 2-selenouridine synthase n=1 Tax=Pseudaquabacterium pictum TaxID=2315236 RepID=A0A480AH30_9BURK|nr:tRNA 2-selenouridine(34) synthase MnmH [Rubrivivax pictus]GCL61069.1 tRNA 2-selenouridine synthase [Rubrivivax pictus]